MNHYHTVFIIHNSNDPTSQHVLIDLYLITQYGKMNQPDARYITPHNSET